MPGRQAAALAQQLFGARLRVDRLGTAGRDEDVDGRALPPVAGGRRRWFEDGGGCRDE